MKMEIAVTAPIGGRVRDVFITRNMQVDAGAPLFRIEPAGEAGDDEPLGHRVTLDGLQWQPPTERQAACRDALGTLRAFVLGFDVRPDRARRAVTVACREPGWAESGGLAILEAFADLLAVSPERRAADEAEIRGPRELFNSYLRSLDVEREGLPAWFEDRLRRALGQYGVTSLEPGPALEEALLRIFLAQQRRPEQEPVITGLLHELAESEDATSSDAGLGPSSGARSAPPPAPRSATPSTTSSTPAAGGSRPWPAWPAAFAIDGSTACRPTGRGPRSRPSCAPWRPA